jgi:O-antigen ligase
MKSTLKLVIKKFLKVITFVPFFGWLFPHYLLKNDEKVQSNTKTAMFLATITVVSLALLRIVAFLIPPSLEIALFAVSMILFVIVLLYLLLCAVGFVLSLFNKNFTLPYITNRAQRFNI